MNQRSDQQPLSADLLIDSELIRPEDVAYTHSLFMQCFLPVRHTAKNREWWEVGNRNAKLVIRAGHLVNPSRPGEVKRCIVPAGPKARIGVVFINDYIYRNNTPLVPLGKNLHQAMHKMGVGVGGKNANELKRELENIAAADITLGLWLPDGSAHQRRALVAESMSYWVEKDPTQGTFWQPEMQVSAEYFRSVTENPHMAPVHMRSIIRLQDRPRAQDIFSFLSYRLHKPLKSPVPLAAPALHAMFGQDVKELRHFWPRFLDALKAAQAEYPAARIEVFDDMIKLYNSPSRVPHRKVGRMGSPLLDH